MSKSSPSPRNAVTRLRSSRFISMSSSWDCLSSLDCLQILFGLTTIPVTVTLRSSLGTMPNKSP